MNPVIREPAPISNQVKGTVKWWNDAKGYGFISVAVEEGSEINGQIMADHEIDAFTHYSALTMEGFKTLTEGQEVTCRLVMGPKGPQAFDVRGVE